MCMNNTIQLIWGPYINDKFVLTKWTTGDNDFMSFKVIAGIRLKHWNIISQIAYPDNYGTAQ